MKIKHFITFSAVPVLLTLITLGWLYFTKPQDTQLNAVGVYLNGLPINIDTIINNGALYVSLEQICYYLKCSYEKDDIKKTINFIKSPKAVAKPRHLDSAGASFKQKIMLKDSGYETTIDGLLLFIKPVVYDKTLYIPLEYFVQSFGKTMQWDFFGRTVEVLDDPSAYAGIVNGEKIKRRFLNERYAAKLAGADEKLKKQGKKLNAAQKKQMETEAFDEAVDLVLASQIARDYGIVIDESMKRAINWYLDSTVDQFGGIDKLRERVGKYGTTYQDEINYFTYSVLMKEVKNKVSKGVKPSDEMMREYYIKSKKTFVHPAKAIVQQIIIPIRDKNENSFSDEKVGEQRKLARKVMDLIKAGGDFEALRRKYSVDYFADTASKPNGFEVVKGNLYIAQIFEDAVFAMKPGQISDVIQTYRGFHIVKLIRKTDETAMMFEEVKERIAKELDYKAKTDHFNKLMAARKEKSEIKRL